VSRPARRARSAAIPRGPRARAAGGAALLAIGLLLGASALRPASLRAEAEEPAAMVRRVLDAPEATASVVLERSDPFGGPPDRERGRVWYIPGQGLRYRVEGRTAQELAANRAADRVTLYRPSEPRLYEAPWARGPLRLRQLVAEPERVVRGAAGAVPETRAVRGVATPGWRLRSGSLGDSLGRVTVWLSRGSAGLPRFVALATDVDTLLVEFRDWSLLAKAKPRDLEIRAPKGTPVSPLDPRDLLDAKGGAGESR
jgi:hypothetical protein